LFKPPTRVSYLSKCFIQLLYWLRPRPHRQLTASLAAIISKMAEHDPLIFQYSHLHHLPRENEAIHALKKIASLVKPIMRARNWKVATLAEFYPEQTNLLGECSRLAALEMRINAAKE